MTRLFGLVFGLGALLASLAPSEAAIIRLNAVDRGWYDTAGNHDPTNDNFITGGCCSARHASFFAFDLSGISGVVTSASLQVRTPDSFYRAPDATTIFRLRKYEGDPAALLAGTAGVDAYRALRGKTATRYGSRRIATPGQDGTMPDVGISLARGLGDLNAMLGGTLVLGGSLRSPGHLWSFSQDEGPRAVRLVLKVEPAATQTAPVPLPASLPLLVAALGLLGLATRRRHRSGR